MNFNIVNGFAIDFVVYKGNFTFEKGNNEEDMTSQRYMIHLCYIQIDDPYNMQSKAR